MKMFQKVVVAAILSLGIVLTASAAAPSATLSEMKGKVEVKAPGASAWTPAKVGMTIAPLATISTGFDSSATITIDKNTIFVKPLTRMSLDKLVEESGTVTTSVFLRVGSAQASVKSAEGVKQNFNVTSPYSTASVRGTEFSFDGLSLDVIEGIVALIVGRPEREGVDPADYAGAPDVKADENKVSVVSAGESAVLQIGGSVTYSADQATLASQTSVSASGSGNPSAGGTTGGANNAPALGGVTVTWQ